MSIVPVLLTDQARAELTAATRRSRAAASRCTNRVGAAGRRCTPPGTPTTAPPGVDPFARQTGVALRTTVPHTADRCACVVAWIAMQARRRGAAG